MTDLRAAVGRSRLRATALSLICVGIAGCQGSMDSLDRQVSDMIAERQRMSLGEQGVSDASVPRPAYPDRTGLYDEKPATYNPPATDLPASPAEPYDPEKPRTYEVDPNAQLTRMDLPALLGYAIEHAPEYRTEKERLFLTTLSLIIERHEWGPRFFNTISSELSGTPESGDYDTAASLINDFTVTQRLPYGGTASISALVNYTNLIQQSSSSTADREQQDAAISASINLPLLRGAGQAAREDLIQAERNLVYAARDFERFRREFFVDISSTYFSLLQQQRRIENQQQQIDGLERLAREQRELAKAGRLPGFEADDAEAQVLFGRSNLASVRDNYSAALDSFKLRIGMPVEEPLAVDRAEIDVPRPALESAKSIQIGQAARLDLQNTRDQVDDARRGVRVARNQLRGDLGLNAAVDLNTDSSKSKAGVDFEPGDSDYNVGLEYSLPLDRKNELARYRSALVDLERAERDYRTQRDRVALDIRDASRQIERATFTLDLQSRNVTLAERRLENINILRRRGEVPARRLIEAEQDLLNARNSRDQARADLETSVLNYFLQTGQMRVDGAGKWLAPGNLMPAEPETKAPAEPAPAE